MQRLQRRPGVASPRITHDHTQAIAPTDRQSAPHQGHPAPLATPMEVSKLPADAGVPGVAGAPALNFQPGEPHRDGTTARLANSPLMQLTEACPAVDEHPVAVGMNGSNPRLRLDLVAPLESEMLPKETDHGQKLVIRVPGRPSGTERSGCSRWRNICVCPIPTRDGGSSGEPDARCNQAINPGRVSSSSGQIGRCTRV
jgi:ABC-type sugar transport system ATPase subunit